MKRKTRKKQPPMPPKGASPAEIKAWLEQCRAQFTPIEDAEYQAAGEAIADTLLRLGFDPVTKERLPADPAVAVDRVWCCEIDLVDFS